MGHAKEKAGVLVAAALGVVFGDIGTSPLYTLKVCFIGQSSITPSPQNVLGLVSLIFWSLMLVVSFKYALFVLKAEDGGEGGVFAMLALLHKKKGASLGRGLIMAGLFGSALLYGDGLITPVISVLSALEGLEVATTSTRPLVVPLTCGILFLLFWAQSQGTGRIGKLFGPVMILWFVVIAVLGVAAISRNPDILAAVNPAHGVRFFVDNGIRGFFLLGAVVLCVTGCEALYADMGHFGASGAPVACSQLFRPGRRDPARPCKRGHIVFQPSSTLFTLPDGPALHDRHDHSLAGHHLRGLLSDQAGHSTGLPSAHEGRAHIGNG
jgi:KUP system potassium uptake protein